MWRGSGTDSQGGCVAFKQSNPQPQHHELARASMYELGRSLVDIYTRIVSGYVRPLAPTHVEPVTDADGGRHEEVRTLATPLVFTVRPPTPVAVVVPSEDAMQVDELGTTTAAALPLRPVTPSVLSQTALDGRSTPVTDTEADPYVRIGRER